MTLSIKNGGYAFLIRLDFKAFYVIMKRVLIVTNFKRPIFVGFCESKWLNEYNLSKSKFYLRYVDDIHVALDKKQYSLNFWKF